MSAFDLDKDEFRYVSIDVTGNPDFAVDFGERLEKSLHVWLQEAVRGAWIKLPKDRSDLIPVAIQNGFDFHHAKPGYVQLVKFLAVDEPDSVPAYANGTVAACGLVVRPSDGKILVIKEKFTTVSAWKFPGGTADLGESLSETAIREAAEETGIDCYFSHVLCFRHLFPFRMGLTDFYFVCVLHPKSEEQPINYPNHEILDCQWMDIDALLADDSFTKSNRFVIQAYKDNLGCRFTVGENELKVNPSFKVFNWYSVSGRDSSSGVS